ncbi:hypothetical protein CEXT_598811 [Caerostris extrusa]|uniref:Uncharacterized protein n=1 Tax=Caerostris extrusa TaxID=172846 RepID=A0AAV4XKC1_CAEEX|nr:hypothetical protein CEXT_598811 [Caerostris extrusa]
MNSYHNYPHRFLSASSSRQQGPPLFRRLCPLSLNILLSFEDNVFRHRLSDNRRFSEGKRYSLPLFHDGRCGGRSGHVTFEMLCKGNRWYTRYCTDCTVLISDGQMEEKISLLQKKISKCDIH